MSNTAKAIMVTAAIGTVVGIGYAVFGRPRYSEARPLVDRPLKPPAAEPKSAPEHPLAHKRINWSTTDDTGTVKESPDKLLAQALRFDSHINLNELTGARLAASEHARGSFAEHACIIDAEQNRAERKGLTLYKSLTYADTFGKQGRTRPASTRRDPLYRHVLAARAVLSGGSRGISRGASRFFDPVAMERMNRKYRRWLDGGSRAKRPAVVSCDALTLLEAWSFDLGRGPSGNRCPPDRSKRGRHTLAWVGPIPGVDPLRLMLMKPMPLGAEHTRRYEQARAVLRIGLQKV